MSTSESGDSSTRGDSASTSTTSRLKRVGMLTLAWVLGFLNVFLLLAIVTGYSKYHYIDITAGQQAGPTKIPELDDLGQGVQLNPQLLEYIRMQLEFGHLENYGITFPPDVLDPIPKPPKRKPNASGRMSKFGRPQDVGRAASAAKNVGRIYCWVAVSGKSDKGFLQKYCTDVVLANVRLSKTKAGISFMADKVPKSPKNHFGMKASQRLHFSFGRDVEPGIFTEKETWNKSVASVKNFVQSIEAKGIIVGSAAVDSDLKVEVEAQRVGVASLLLESLKNDGIEVALLVPLKPPRNLKKEQLRLLASSYAALADNILYPSLHFWSDDFVKCPKTVVCPLAMSPVGNCKSSFPQIVASFFDTVPTVRSASKVLALSLRFYYYSVKANTRKDVGAPGQYSGKSSIFSVMKNFKQSRFTVAKDAKSDCVALFSPKHAFVGPNLAFPKSPSNLLKFIKEHRISSVSLYGFETGDNANSDTDLAFSNIYKAIIA